MERTVLFSRTHGALNVGGTFQLQKRGGISRLHRARRGWEKREEGWWGNTRGVKT